MQISFISQSKTSLVSMCTAKWADVSSGGGITFNDILCMRTRVTYDSHYQRTEQLQLRLKSLGIMRPSFGGGSVAQRGALSWQRVQCS